MQVKSVPTIIIVHASRGYDRQASAKRSIESTLERCMPTMVLEVEDPKRPSYLTLSRLNKFPVSGDGDLISNGFHKIKAPWLNTETFIFCGGAVNRCLIHSFISILLFKIYTPDSVFNAIKNGPDPDKPDFLKRFFACLTKRDGSLPLDFHFNCEGIYPATEDFKAFSLDDRVVYWSANIIWQMMAAMIKRHRIVLETSGLNIAELVNGKVISVNLHARPSDVNLYYWSDTESLAHHITGA
jgi:hypothetical protein